MLIKDSVESLEDCEEVDILAKGGGGGIELLIEGGGEGIMLSQSRTNLNEGELTGAVGGVGREERWDLTIALVCRKV